MAEKDKEREKLIRKLLSHRDIKHIDEIAAEIPLMPAFLGPGRWIAALKTLDKENKGKGK